MAVGLAKAYRYGHQALLERYITGREFTVGILDAIPLPIIELRSPQPFFNYEAKYTDKTTEFVTKPELSPELCEKLQSAALSAHEALGCQHFSRVDMMLETDGSPYVLEVNTIPGMTSRSLLPLAARELGISFGDLCERIVEAALVSEAATEVHH